MKRPFLIALAACGILFYILFLQTGTATIHDFVLPFSPQTAEEKALLAYWLTVKYDPIAHQAGADIEALALATEIHKQGSDTIATYYPEEERYILELLKSEDLLQSYITTERARRAFLSSPTAESATAYQSELTTLLTLHSQQITALINVLTETDPVQLGFYSGYMTPQQQIDTLRKLQQQVTQSTKLHEERVTCFTSSAPHCQDLDFSVRIEEYDAREYTPDAVDSEVANLLSIRAVHETAKPYVVLENSRCYEHEPTQYYLWKAQPTTLQQFYRLAPTRDLAYFNVSEMQSVPYFTMYAERNKTYATQIVTHYMCPDFSFDTARVITAHALREEIAQQPLFLHSKEHPALSALEAQVVESDVLSVADVTTYLYTLEEVLTESTQIKLEKTAPGVYDRAWELLLAWEAKSKGFENDLQALELMHRNSLDVLERMPIPKEGLLLTRSYSSILLNTANRSLIPHPHYFIANVENVPLGDFRLYSYRNDLRGVIDDTHLQNITRD